MYDDSRRSQEDYGDDGAGYAQNIIYFFGKYKMGNGNYLMKPTNGARVVFKDSASVDRGVISFYKEKNYEKDFRAVGDIVCKLKKWTIHARSSNRGPRNHIEKMYIITSCIINLI